MNYSQKQKFKKIFSLLMPLTIITFGLVGIAIFDIDYLGNNTSASIDLVTYGFEVVDDIDLGETVRVGVLIPQTSNQITGTKLKFSISDPNIAVFSGITVGNVFDTVDQLGQPIAPEVLNNYCTASQCEITILAPCDKCAIKDVTDSAAINSCQSVGIIFPRCYATSQSGFIAYIDVTGINLGSTQIQMSSPAFTATVGTYDFEDNVTDPNLPALSLAVVESN